LLDLPLNNRNSLDFMMLQSSDYQDNEGMYSIGGDRSVFNNFTIDGVSANSAAFGGQVGPMTQESFDAVSDMKMDTSNNSAAYPDIGTLMIQDRSGTNQFHGSLFDYENNWALNTRPFFAGSIPKGPIEHDFGGSFGGPVILPGYNGRDKTFFYFTYEREDFPGEYVSTAQVPTAAMKAGDFSQLLPGTVITNPATGQPFAGNIIPPGDISAVSKNIQNFGFLPPNDVSQFKNGYDWVGVLPSASHDSRYVTRIDHNIGSKDRLFGRSSFRDIPEPLNFTTGLPLFYFNEHRTTNNAMLGETHSFGPTLLNEFRIAFSRDASNYGDSHANGVALTQSLGLQEPYLDLKGGLSGFPQMSFVNFNSISSLDSNFWRSQTTEVLDNITWVKGKHQFKWGVLFRHNYINITNCCSYDFGQANFSGFATGFDYADFLLGIPQTSTLNTRNRPSVPRYDQLGLYMLDDIQVSPRLTVNLGLRWDYESPPVESTASNMT
jgi:hypothetical protein